MNGPFRLPASFWKLVYDKKDILLGFGPGGPLGEMDSGGTPHDPSAAYRPVRTRRGPGGRSDGVAVAEPDEEMLVMAVASPRARH
jgi:hypothetical protein